MKRLFLSLSIVLCGPPGAWADPALEQAEGLLRNAVGSFEPRGFRVAPVKSREEKNTGFTPHPSDLGTKQLEAFLQRLVDLENRYPEESKTFKNHVPRLAHWLQQIGKNYVDTVPRERWDRILSGLAESAEKNYGSAKGDWEKLVDAMVAQAVSELGDLYSGFMSAQQMRELRQKMQDTLTGIGIEVTGSKEPPGLLVEGVFPDGPAKAAGIREGDVIVSVEDSPAWPDLEAAINAIRGKRGTPVSLEVRRPGRAEPLRISSMRDEVHLRNLFAKQLSPDTGYVHFAVFTKTAYAELREEIQKLRRAGVRKLVLDIRSNPGGLYVAGADIASEFLADGRTIVSTHQGPDWKDRRVAAENGLFMEMPLAVLVNAGSASASEIVAGALQDHRRAVVIGDDSLGKGSGQTILPEDPYDENTKGLRLTTFRWHAPSGRSLDCPRDPATFRKTAEGCGISPDIAVKMEPELARRVINQIRRELRRMPPKGPPAEDPVLKKAIEVLAAVSAT